MASVASAAGEYLVDTEASEGADEEVETPEEQWERLVKLAEHRLNWCKSSTDRQDFERRCKDASNFWRARQWDGVGSFGIPARSAETKKLHANPVDNLFKAQVEGLIGDCTDRPADIQIRPAEPGDDEIAQKMERTVQHVWYVNKGDRKLEFIVRRAVLYGPLIGKVCWDPDWRGSPANPFVGEVRFFGVSPINLFIDPRVKAIDEGVIQQAEFLIYGVRRSLNYIRKHYPERGHLVRPDTYATYVDTLAGNPEDQTIDEADAQALLIEYWYRGQPMAPDFPYERDDDTPEDVEKADGVHLAVIAGGVLLKHVSYVYPWYPFVMEWMYPSDETIYGYSDAYDMLMPQLVINKLNELSIEGHALHSKGNWLINEGAVRNKQQFQKYAGMGGSVLPVVDVNQARREMGGGVPNSLFTHYRQAQQSLETAVGRFDINQGRAPRGVRAASAIALLLQQGAGRIRQRARAMSSFIRQVVEMIVYLIETNYTTERMIRVIGEQDNVRLESVSRADFVKTKTFVDWETGGEREEEYIPEFDIRVIAGADTTASKAYFAELAIQLYQMGVIDEIALLEILEFPRWREVLQRKRQALAQQAQQAQQAQRTPQGMMSPEQVAAALHGPATDPERQAVANPYAYLGGEGGGDVAELGRLINQLRGGG